MSSDRENNVLNTYRYLRMGLAALAALLLASVVLQIGKNDGCYQTSISAYFFTPSHAVFVAGLCAIGACLIIYQGDTTTEDVLLNFTGAAAFIIAFVPTGIDKSCSGSKDVDIDTITNVVSNSVWAFLIAAVLAVVFARILNPGTFQISRWTTWDKIWFTLTSAAMIFGLAEFVFNRDGFTKYAHRAAASSLFAGLILVVVINALTHRKIRAKQDKDTNPVKNPYALLAVVMIAVTAVMGVFKLWITKDWRHSLFWIEISVIGEFMVFWGIQTKLLWGYVTPTEKLEDVRADG
jgi:hypothetical protein